MAAENSPQLSASEGIVLFERTQTAAQRAQGAVEMPVGWALVRKEERRQWNFSDLAQHLNSEAGKLRDKPPWASSVQFKVTQPLSVHWTDVHTVPIDPKQPDKGTRQTQQRKPDALIEIDGVSKEQLGEVFEFIHENCSHVDGFG